MFNPERYGLQVSYAFEKRAQILDKWNDEGCPPPPPSQQAVRTDTTTIRFQCLHFLTTLFSYLLRIKQQPYHPPPTPPPFGPNPNNVVPPSPIAPSSVVHPSAPSDQEQTIDLKDWVKLATRNAECIAGNAECIAGNATATANLADGLSKVTDGLSKVKVVVNDVADGLQKVTNEVSHLWHHKNEGIARMNGFEDQVAALTSEFRQLAHLKQNGGNTPLTAPSVASECKHTFTSIIIYWPGTLLHLLFLLSALQLRMLRIPELQQRLLRRLERSPQRPRPHRRRPRFLQSRPSIHRHLRSATGLLLQSSPRRRRCRREWLIAKANSSPRPRTKSK